MHTNVHLRACRGVALTCTCAYTHSIAHPLLQMPDARDVFDYLAEFYPRELGALDAYFVGRGCPSLRAVLSKEVALTVKTCTLELQRKVEERQGQGQQRAAAEPGQQSGPQPVAPQGQQQGAAPTSAEGESPAPCAPSRDILWQMLLCAVGMQEEPEARAQGGEGEGEAQSGATRVRAAAQQAPPGWDADRDPLPSEDFRLVRSFVNLKERKSQGLSLEEQAESLAVTQLLQQRNKPSASQAAPLSEWAERKESYLRSSRFKSKIAGFHFDAQALQRLVTRYGVHEWEKARKKVGGVCWLADGGCI